MMEYNWSSVKWSKTVKRIQMVHFDKYRRDYDKLNMLNKLNKRYERSYSHLCDGHYKLQIKHKK